MFDSRSTAEGPPKISGGLRLFQLFLVMLAVLFLIAPYFPEKWFIVFDKTGAAFLFDRGHGHWIPLDLLWGTLGWARIHWPVRAMLIPLVILLCFWPQKMEPAAACDPKPITKPRFLAITIFALLSGALFVLLRVDPTISRTFGDASSLQSQVREGGWVFPSEVLTMHVFNMVHDLLITIAGDLSSYTANVVVCSAGAVFVWASLITAMLIGRSRVERLFLFTGPVFAGYLTQYFGYVETTFLALAAMALFFAAAAWMLEGQGSQARRNRLMLVFVCVSIAMLAHGAGVVLLPPAVLLVWFLDPQAKGFGRLRALKDPWITIGFIGIVMVPYYLIFVRPFMIEMDFFGNMRGGADQFNFVPWDYEAARAVSNYVYYGMISWGHLLDVGMGFLVGAPLAVPMALTAIGGLRRLDRSEFEYLSVAVLAGLSAASVPILWELDFGGWGDWNIITAYIYPLNFMGWLALIVARRRRPMPVRSVLIPALIVQIAMWMGIQLQFYK